MTGKTGSLLAAIAIVLASSTCPASSATRDEISGAQQALISLGLLRGQADGVMGAKTHAAIRMFQREKGLAATGELDRETYERLLTPTAQPPGPRPAEALPAPAHNVPASPDGQTSSPSPDNREPADSPSRTPIAPFASAALVAIIGLAYLRRRRHRHGKTPMEKSQPKEATGKGAGADTPGTPPAPGRPPGSPSETAAPRRTEPAIPTMAGAYNLDAARNRADLADALSLHNARVDEVIRERQKTRAALAAQSPPAPAGATAEPSPDHLSAAPSEETAPAVPTMADAYNSDAARNRADLADALSLHNARVNEVIRERQKSQSERPAQTPAPLVKAEEQGLSRPSTTAIADDAIRRALAIQAGRPSPLPNPDAGRDGEDVNWGNLGFARMSPPPKPAGPAAAGCWIPKSQGARVGDFALPAGMIYVGQVMAPLQGQGTDRCLIDPGLPVRPGYAMAPSYYPSYRGFSPEQRHAYLAWLRKGRTDPTVDIGYVFLFFYGLERRLMGEGAREDEADITAEVERLRDLYGSNASFRRYSGELLAAARLRYMGIPDKPPALREPQWEMPMDLKAGLGALLIQGGAITAEWALAWLRCDPEMQWRTPATRVPDIFERLFYHRFTETYPDGLRAKAPQRKLSAAYAACSSDFRLTFTLTFNDTPLPDPTALRAPQAKFRPIAEQCMAELDGYSRLLGRYPERVDSLEAYGLLPADLRSQETPATIRSLIDQLASATAAGPALLPYRDLAEKILPDINEKPSRREVQTIGQLLSIIGFGIEPDPGFGGRTLRPAEPVAIFALAGTDVPATASDAYQTAVLHLHLGVLVAAADQHVSDDERQTLLDHCVQGAGLSPAEASRLAAHLRWLEACPPDFAAIRTRIAPLPPAQKTEVGRLAIEIALADGLVNPDEVKLLERLYKALGFDPASVYSDLHQPVPSRSPLAPAALAPSVAGGSGTVSLDLDRIRRIQADTSHVSSVLGQIFADEIEPALPPLPPAPEIAADGGTSGDNALEGLDRRHAELLLELAGRPEWPRPDYETLARSLGLMPDGALETINEWSFDRFDDAIVEDGDPLVLSPDLLEEAGLNV